MLSQLNFRQQEAWGQVFSCFRQADGAIDGDGKEADGEWEVVFADEPAALHYTQNLSRPAKVARIKSLSALTLDRVICWIGLDIQDGDMLLDTTPGSPNQGQWACVQGQSRRVPSVGIRELDYQVIESFTEEQPSDALRTLAGV